MDKWQALQQFWESFGLPAYDEGAVPDDAVMPYITYSASADSLDNLVFLSGSVWYRSTSWEEASQKADSISRFIGNGGIILKLNSGYLYITRGTPFARRVQDESDDLVRRIYLNINCEFLTDK